MDKKTCIDCKHAPANGGKLPCRICFTGYPERGFLTSHWEEKPEPDYKFNDKIIEALKAGKDVYWKCDCGDESCNKWIVASEDTNIVMSDIYDCKWAVEKPKVKVKKWQYIYKKDGFFYFTENHYKSYSHAQNKHFSKIIEVYLPSEIEVEE